MASTGVLDYYLHLATEKDTQKRAFKVAFFVGVILNSIHHPELFLSFSFEEFSPVQILLTFLVPYCVSTYSTVSSKSNLKSGKVSHLDAILKCKSCKNSKFHAHVGQVVQECPDCNKKTRWKPLKIFSKLASDSDLMKSLALFARYNPQPLFRTDGNWGILSANLASENLLGNFDLQNKDLSEYFPEISPIDTHELIHKENVAEKLVHFGDKCFNLVLKGVPVLDSIQVYANNITEIVLAQRKIKEQADEIQQSINYAWKIQQAMLTNEEFIKGIFKNHFVFYLPKNTVSGDFYWVNLVNNYRIVVVGDCTGHGVPGAFMSIMGISLLNEIILREKILEPDLILNTIRERLISLLNSESQETNIADGMDISLIVLDYLTNTISYAGAYNPLYVINNKELSILEADRMPVGEHVNDKVPFSAKTHKMQPGDRLFLFTDGFKDQYGGENNKKLTTKKFKELLIDSSHLPIKEQGNSIRHFFYKWRNSTEQIDDVLIMAIDI